jgi:hypothetical protein
MKKLGILMLIVFLFGGCATIDLDLREDPEIPYYTALRFFNGAWESYHKVWIQLPEETKTEWFEPTVKPVHVGEYEAKDPEHPNWPFAEYATWNGKQWVNGDGKKIKIAKWRGLREDPNGS